MRTTKEQRDTAITKLVASSASTYTKEVVEAIRCMIDVCADLEEAGIETEAWETIARDLYTAMEDGHICTCYKDHPCLNCQAKKAYKDKEAQNDHK